MSMSCSEDMPKKLPYNHQHYINPYGVHGLFINKIDYKPLRIWA